MKKIILVLVLFVILLSLGACGLPTEPQEITQFCQEEYEIRLAVDPDYPQAFVGACTASLITGKPEPLKAMCGYEPFWEDLSPEVNSRQDCIKFINTIEPE